MFQDFRVAYLRQHLKIREVEPLSTLRQSVSYMLSKSAREIPHVAGMTQYDVTPLVEYTRALGKQAPGDDEAENDVVLRRALNRSYSAFFLKAIAHCLYHVPCLNGFLDYTPYRNGGTFYRAEDINLGFTVHTNYGVIKPVVRNPHLKDLVTVGREMRNLSRRARRTDPEELHLDAARVYVRTALRQLDFSALGALWIYLRARLWRHARHTVKFTELPAEQKLTAADILGATCTIANIGMMVHGHQTVTVLVPPEVSFFGIGDVHLAPCVVDGAVVPRHVVTICITMDHRPFDAGEAFPIYQQLKRYIDNPELIYDWKPGDPV